MQGETCKGTVMRRNVFNLCKKKDSVLGKKLV